MTISISNLVKMILAVVVIDGGVAHRISALSQTLLGIVSVSDAAIEERSGSSGQ